MALSAEEKNFNDRVANTPVVKEILDDLSGLKDGQIKIGDDMESLKQEVKEGFAEVKSEFKQDISQIADGLTALATEIKDEKTATLQKSYDKLEVELTRKRKNGDTVKNTLLGGGGLGFISFILEKLGYITF